MAVCLKPVSFYACSNSSGTSCTETALIQTFNVSTNPVDSSCSYVLVSGSEFQAMISNPFNMSLSDAQDIFIAAVPVLAIAWGIRLVIRTMSQPEVYHE